jgi:hypothetical protein
MKKLLYVIAAALCLVACEKNSENGSGSTAKGDFVDLGLASGTKWKTQNEQNTYDYYDLFDYETALREFGNNLPTSKQWEELRAYCHWEWVGSGYKVTGPNGKSIVLPAAGYRDCGGSVSYVGSLGLYWSSTPNGSENAWSLSFNSGRVNMDYYRRCYGLSVRLVR